jgi:hypothetical protein
MNALLNSRFFFGGMICDQLANIDFEIVAELTNKSCINPSILILAIPVEVGARNVQIFAKLILGNVPICNDFLYIKRQISVAHITNPSLLR